MLEQLKAWPQRAATPIETIHVSQRGGFGRTLMDKAEQQQSGQRASRRATQGHQPLADQAVHIRRPRHHRARDERKDRHGHHGRSNCQKSLVDRWVEIVGFPPETEKPGA